MQLIGLAGPAGCGKDTVAALLCSHHGFVQISLADPIRAGLISMFGLAEELLHRRDLKEARIDWLGRSPRELMQTLGTEWGRERVAPDVWLRVAEQRIERLKASPPCLHIAGIVVSDIRFPNEAQWLQGLGGTLWHISRRGQGLTGDTARHASEQPLLQRDGDITLLNNGTLEELEDGVAATIWAYA